MGSRRARVVRRLPCPKVTRILVSLDHVVNLQHLRRADEFDAVLTEDRHQPLTELLKLLLGVPNLAHAEAATSSESNMKVEAIGGELAGRLDQRQDLLVLRCRHARSARETDEDTHGCLLI